MKPSDVHVLHVVPTWEVGGLELTLGRLAATLARRGMRQSIACIRGGPQAPTPPEAEFHFLRSDGGASLPWRLWRLMRRVRPTIVHARNWGAWPEAAVVRLLAGRPPLIFSFHGWCDTAPLSRRRRLMFRLLERITTHLFAVSEGARQSLLERAPLRPRRVGVICNGVDTDLFQPRQDRPAGGRLVIGTAGALVPVKNHAALIEACAQLRRLGLEAELHIAGVGPLEGALRQAAAAAGLEDALRLDGCVRDMPAFYHSLDVFVLPSLTEGQPNALLEAMASALPCVGADIPSIREVLDGGRLGVLCHPRDPSALAAAVASLAASDERRRELAQAARRHVCQRYGLDRMADRYTALYLHLAARRERSTKAKARRTAVRA